MFFKDCIESEGELLTTQALVIKTLQGLIKRLSEEKRVITNSAIQLIGNEACEKHEKKLSKMSFNDFRKLESIIGCKYCAWQKLLRMDELLSNIHCNCEDEKK